MKKIIGVLMALALVLAFAPAASAAVDAGAGRIKITAQEIDYVSALAGIAKPVSKAHAENERFAVLVSIKIPTWLDTTNMAARIEREGVMIDGGSGIPIATGDYIIFGTLYSAAARITITLEDNAINAASSAQELWRALYGDRSVSATVSFAPQAAAMQQMGIQPATGIQTVMIAEVPQTGGAPSGAAVVAIMAAAFIFAAVCAAKKTIK